MSVSKKQVAPTGPAGLTDQIVREYLKNHDDFLQRNPDMLDFLHISHASGSAISLVEKQVSVLRERNMDMRQRLKLLTANARANDLLYEQTRTLVLKLLDADSTQALYRIFMDAMATDFQVEYASMIFYDDQPVADGLRTEAPATVKAEIGSLFRGGKPVCGTLRKEELKFLFPDGGDVGSAALMPLMTGTTELGLIAVGSSNANRYNNKVGTMFLSHIADVIVKMLARLQPAGD
jgi:hypothetical protein